MPDPVDNTFGPEVAFSKGAPSVVVDNPGFGYQHFGEVTIESDSRAMTVRLRDVDGNVAYTTALTPKD